MSCPFATRLSLPFNHFYATRSALDLSHPFFINQSELFSEFWSVFKNFVSLLPSNEIFSSLAFRFRCLNISENWFTAWEAIRTSDSVSSWLESIQFTTFVALCFRGYYKHVAHCTILDSEYLAIDLIHEVYFLFLLRLYENQIHKTKKEIFSKMKVPD